MSHIVTISTQVRDPAAIRAACERLQLAAPVLGEARLFSGSKAGWQVQLPDWRYPVICDIATGTLHYDNFNGRWGDPEKLGQLLQMYAVEKARIEARKKGHTCTEALLSDGSIKLTIEVGSAT